MSHVKSNYTSYIIQKTYSTHDLCVSCLASLETCIIPTISINCVLVPIVTRIDVITQKVIQGAGRKKETNVFKTIQNIDYFE